MVLNQYWIRLGKSVVHLTGLIAFCINKNNSGHLSTIKKYTKNKSKQMFQTGKIAKEL